MDKIKRLFDINKNKELLKEGNLYKGIILVALPLMISNLIQTIYNLTDTYWVTKISEDSLEVGSVSLVWPIIMLMLTIGMGLSVAATTLVSQYIGADDKDSANKVISQLVLISLGIGILMSLIMFFVAEPIATLMAGDEVVLIKDSVIYLKIISFQGPIFYLYMIFQASRQGQGDTVTPLIYSAIGAALNMILDPIFILHFEWGVAGAAAATVLSKAILFLYPIYILFKDKTNIHVDLKYIIPNSSFIKKITIIALPIMISQSASSFGFAILNSIINSYGASIFTAFAMGNRISSLFMMPVMGMGAAVSTFVGVAIGSDNIKRAKKAFKVSNILASSLALFFTVILILLRFNATKVFIDPNDKIVYNLTAEYLIFIALCLIPMGLFQNFQGLFNGSGHTLYSVIITMSRLWIFRLPVIWFASTFTNLDHQIIWYAMFVSNIFVCLLGYIIYRFSNWTEKVI